MHYCKECQDKHDLMVDYRQQLTQWDSRLEQLREAVRDMELATETKEDRARRNGMQFALGIMEGQWTAAQAVQNRKAMK